MGLNLDQHLAGIRAGEQADEGVWCLFQAVHHGFPALDCT